uniref:Sodium-independent sulfate anion transporter n=1 Tax=Cacopsylla melanoneura TaxID=428564 RepID=A0A8D8UTY8_9HEMI
MLEMNDMTSNSTPGNNHHSTAEYNNSLKLMEDFVGAQQKIKLPSKRKKFMKRLERHVPFINTIRTYTKEDAIADAIAGITVGLTLIPQSLAYASLAGLPETFGLNSAFMGAFAYMLLGSIKEVSIGPTSLMALLTYEFTHDLTPNHVILLTFLSGVVTLIMGLLNLGFLVNLISSPVTSGFTTATSIIIIITQLKGILGLKIRAKGCINYLIQYYENMHLTRPGDLTLGISCIVFLLVMRKVKDIPMNKERILYKCLWYMSTGRNVLIVLITACISYRYEVAGEQAPFILVGHVKPGIPQFQLPPFSTTVGNHTVEFTQMFRDLTPAIFVVPLVAILANVSISKAFGSSGPPVDATHEMLTLSVCNILGSFACSMPTCGAFTRSAVANASGIRTPFGNLYSGILVLLALELISPLFRLIPKATLSSILICAVIFLVDYQIVKPLWRFYKFDLAIVLVTLSSCLYFGVEVGLAVGVSLNLTYLVYVWARPKIQIETVKTSNGTYVMVKVDVGLTFPEVDDLYNAISKQSVNYPVVLDCTHFTILDYTGVQCIGTLARDFESKNQQLVLLNLPECVSENFKKLRSANVHRANSIREAENILFGLSNESRLAETRMLMNEKRSKLFTQRRNTLF